MTKRLAPTIFWCAALFTAASAAAADDPIPPTLKEYFRAETERIAARPLLDVKSPEEWKSRRPELQRRMREMLGLDPLPARTDLKPEIRGFVERPDFVVERIVFQSSPGLYVTANLYRPKVVEKPLPAVLYVCGHGKEEKDGVIYGCKTHYQHHGEWFGANGYVCLIVDTLQLGEVPGLHHGTHHLGMWWWQTLGYTPAGVEVWNGIRAIDYLCSRPEVDAERLGVAGRSGGGAMSWYLGAVDDRLKVVAPTAGISDLRDHVVAGAPKGAFPGGVVDGHCDCMFFVNTYRWDYPMLAALVAPKALLFENTDADSIFPEAGVRRVFDQLETVYGWYGERDKLDLIIGKGGHADTEELRHPEFAWFERWLKGDSGQRLADVKEPNRRLPNETLKVLEPRKPIPANVNDTVHESFIPAAVEPALPANAAAWQALKASWLAAVEAKVFGDAPSGETASTIVTRPYTSLSAQHPAEIVKGGLGVTAYEYASQDAPDMKQRVWMFHDPGRAKAPSALELLVMGPDDWRKYGPLIDAFESASGDPSSLAEFASIKAKADAGALSAFVAPLGVGRTAWPASKDTTIRRRFALLGKTLDGYRVSEVRGALRCLGGPEAPAITLVGGGDMAAVALWAACLERSAAKLVLIDPPSTVRDGPAFLNLARIIDMPQAVALLYPTPVQVVGSPAYAWSWPRALAERLGSPRPWPATGP